MSSTATCFSHEAVQHHDDDVDGDDGDGLPAPGQRGDAEGEDRQQRADDLGRADRHDAGGDRAERFVGWSGRPRRRGRRSTGRCRWRRGRRRRTPGPCAEQRPARRGRRRRRARRTRGCSSATAAAGRCATSATTPAATCHGARLGDPGPASPPSTHTAWSASASSSRSPGESPYAHSSTAARPPWCSSSQAWRRRTFSMPPAVAVRQRAGAATVVVDRRARSPRRRRRRARRRAGAGRRRTTPTRARRRARASRCQASRASVSRRSRARWRSPRRTPRPASSTSANGRPAKAASRARALSASRSRAGERGDDPGGRRSTSRRRAAACRRRAAGTARRSRACVSVPSTSNAATTGRRSVAGTARARRSRLARQPRGPSQDLDQLFGHGIRRGPPPDADRRSGRPEVRPALRHDVGIGHDDAGHGGAEHAERHRQAVVVVGRQHGAVQVRRLDAQPVGRPRPAPSLSARRPGHRGGRSPWPG